MLSASELASAAQEALLLRYCSRPRYVPRLSTADRAVFIRCHTSRQDQCLSCANLYAKDWRRIIFSGTSIDRSLLDQPDNEAEGARVARQREHAQAVLADCTFLFVTYTAPSFGSVHHVPKHESDKPTTCKCGAIHTWNERGLAGVPLDHSHYDYGEQVEWNYGSSELWANTRKRLQRAFPGMEYALAREWQARGTIHYHVLIRLPYKVSNRRKVVASVRATRWTVATISWMATDGSSGQRQRASRTVSWGRQQDVQVIDPSTKSTARTVGYLAKAVTYTLKSLADYHSHGHATHPDAVRHLRSIERAARRMRHPGHTGRDCPNPVHENWGAKGRRVVTSPNWSLAGLSRVRLREARKTYAEQVGLHLSKEEQRQRLVQAMEHMTPQQVEEITQTARAWRRGVIWEVLLQRVQAQADKVTETRKTPTPATVPAAQEGRELLAQLLAKAGQRAAHRGKTAAQPPGKTPKDGGEHGASRAQSPSEGGNSGPPGPES